MLDPCEGCREVPARVGLGVVGQHRIDPVDAVVGEEPQGPLQEPRARRAALIVVDLGVGQATVGVDRRMHVAHPTAALIAAGAHRRPPVGAPPTTVGDPAELLDIHMHQLTRPVVVILRITRPVGRSIHANRLSPNRHSTRCTVEGAIPSLAAILTGPIFSARRSRSTSTSTCCGVRCGQWCGRLGRSRSPSGPSSRNRRHHFHAVARDTPISSATCATGRPDAIRPTIVNLPCTVNAALPCTPSLLEL